MEKLKLATAIVLSALAARINAQSSQSNCNNQTRTVQITAGTHNQGSATCGTFGFSVGAASYASPGSCTTGYAFYHGTVYSCGPQSTGSDCNANGYKVKLDLYTGGACPSITGLQSGLNFSNWMSVPLALINALSCSSPSKEETFDWSAKVSRCTILDPPLQAPPPISPVDDLGDSYMEIDGDPLDFVNAATAPSFERPASLWSDARDWPSGLLPSIQAIRSVNQGLAAASLRASVIRETVEQGQVTNQNSFQWTGEFSNHGLFDAHRVVTIAQGSESFILDEHCSFDGTVLTSNLASAEAGNLWTTDFGHFSFIHSSTADGIDEIALWLADPFNLPAFQSVILQEESLDGVLTVRQEHGAEQPWIGWELAVSESTPTRPHRVTIYDELHRKRVERRYSNYTEISSGLMRPMTVQTEFYPTGVPEQLTQRATWNFGRVQHAAAIEVPPPLPGRWQVWQ